jgi:glycerophosphoryl diester phosphodiesterase family protein
MFPPTLVLELHVQPHSTPRTQGEVFAGAITSHRAGSARAPENNLAALENAIADGADVVEIDVQETADGEGKGRERHPRKNRDGDTGAVQRPTYPARITTCAAWTVSGLIST